MASEAEIEEKFWKVIRSDRTVMLGLAGVEEGHAQPMTAMFEDGDAPGPIWFFTANDTDLAKALGSGGRATAHFADKGHDLFASFHGDLAPDMDPARIEALWNPFVAAWFEEGKTDPKLLLLRMDPEHGQVWLNGSSMLAGIKMLFWSDPKEDYQDKVAEVRLDD